MAVENQNILDKKPNSTESYQGESNKDILKNEIEKWAKGEDKEKAREIDKIVRDIVAFPRSPAELEGIVNTLPIDKRFIVEKMILDEQKHQIATMSQERYKQYLQAQFPSGVPSNVGEIALSMVTDTSEMYRKAQEEITKTYPENPSESEKEELRKDKKEAVVATQSSEQQAGKLSNELSQVMV